MMILKDSQTSILFSPFAIGGEWYLQVAVLLYFNLNSPQTLLSEQDLWTDCKPFLGEKNLLDMGFPKKTSEILVAGSWYSPQKSKVQAGKVFIKVGSIERELLLFGDRYWQQSPMGYVISEPEFTKQIPVTLENAYGGTDYSENPTGKGYILTETEWGEKRKYLPNIEDPKKRIFSPKDTPKPAVFSMLPLNAASRIDYAGTYSTHWQQEEWFGFPSDVQAEYFYLASAEQRLDSGYFQGGEEVLIKNMHPIHEQIQGSIPHKCVRVFSTAKEITTTGETENKELFTEYSTHLDTVWLFPENESGVTIHRAVMKIKNDEFREIDSLLLAVENPYEQEDIHFWQEKQKKMLELPDFEISPSVLEPAKKTVEENFAELRTIEEDTAHVIAQSINEAPSLRFSIEKQKDMAEKQLQTAINSVESTLKERETADRKTKTLLKKNTIGLLALKKDIETMMTETSNNFQEFIADREHIQNTKKQIQENFNFTKQVMTKMPTEEGQKALNTFFPSSVLEKLTMPLESPSELWQTAAMTLLADHLIFSSEIDCKIKTLLRSKNLYSSCIAYLKTTETFLEDSLPKGFVIPYFEKNHCLKLEVRTPKAQFIKKEDCLPFQNILTSAEQEQEYTSAFFPCIEETEGIQILAGGREKPLLVTFCPLTAWYYYGLVGDLFAIAIISHTKAVLHEQDAYLKKAAHVFALFPQIDEAKAKDLLSPYQELFPQTEALLWNKDFCAIHLPYATEKGLNPRAWLMEELEKRDILTEAMKAKGGNVEIVTDEKGQSKLVFAIPALNITALIEKNAATINNHIDGKLDIAMAEINESFKIAEELAKERNLPFISMEDLKNAPSTFPPLDKETMDRYDTIAEKLDSLGKPKEAQQVREEKITIQKIYDESMVIYADAMQQKAKAERIFPEGEDNAINMQEMIPDWAKDNPEIQAAVAPAEEITPALLLAKIQKGETGIHLENIDFSNQDLSNYVFDNVFMENVNFTDCDLSKSIFRNVIATKVNFSNANLQYSTQILSNFTEATFVNTQCENMKIELTQWNTSIIQDVDFTGSNFSNTGLQDSYFTGNIQGGTFYLTTFSGTFENCNFIKISCEKGMFLNAQFIQTLFTQSTVQESSFFEFTAEHLTYSHCNLYNMRIIGKAECHYICFDNCDLTSSSFRNATLNEASFISCILNSACIDEMTMPFVKMTDCSAKEAHIRHSNLEGAVLRNLNMPCGSLRYTRLVQADLTGANLFSCELYKAVLGNTLLDDVNLKNTLLYNKEDTLQKEEYII